MLVYDFAVKSRPHACSPPADRSEEFLAEVDVSRASVCAVFQRQNNVLDETLHLIFELAARLMRNGSAQYSLH
jgi:hypothetical protein